MQGIGLLMTIYNEDTDLSLRVLKSGRCTILFNAFLANKTATMTLKGGNTDELYKQNKEFDGRLEMARSLERQHPDVVKVTRKWGRWQHHVDYRPFRGNRLILRDGVQIPDGVNNFGMKLVNIETEKSHGTEVSDGGRAGVDVVGVPVGEAEGAS